MSDEDLDDEVSVDKNLQQLHEFLEILPIDVVAADGLAVDGEEGLVVAAFDLLLDEG